jgi:type II secretory pathway pseudopilin PulG
MKYSSRVEGFTIVETLIVLAVTSALFVSAALVIGGKQNATQFSQGIRDIESQILKVSNDVSSGYYPNNGKIECKNNSGTLELKEITLGPDQEQGTNKGCVFLGKIMHFAVGSTNSSDVNVYSLVGLRLSNYPVEANAFADTKPHLIAKSDSVLDKLVPDIYDTLKLPYGQTVGSLTYSDSVTHSNPIKIGAFGYVTRVGASLESIDKAEQVDLVAIPGTNLGDTKGVGVGYINNNVAAAIRNPAGGIRLCVKSGGTNQSAQYIIGAEGKPMSVSVVVKNSGVCP